jgi:hypothetical protein
MIRTFVIGNARLLLPCTREFTQHARGPLQSKIRAHPAFLENWIWCVISFKYAFPLVLEHASGNFDPWKRAFDSDPLGRRKPGVRCYHILPPTDNLNYVIKEFDGSKEAKNWVSSAKHVEHFGSTASHAEPPNCKSLSRWKQKSVDDFCRGHAVANHVKPSLLSDNSDIWTLKYEKDFCEQMAKIDPQIAIAALIDEKGQPVDWHVKEGIPVPKEDRSAVMALQTMMVMSLAKTAADYLGELEYLHTKMAKMDVIHFPAFGDGILAVVLQRPFDEALVATRILCLLRHA